MNAKKVNELVGKSFEDLTVDEMRELQGAADVTVDSTPTIFFSLSATAASAALSGQVSKAISTLVTAARKCAE